MLGGLKGPDWRCVSVVDIDIYYSRDFRAVQKSGQRTTRRALGCGEMCGGKIRSSHWDSGDLPGSIQLEPAAIRVAFLRLVDDRERAVSIFQTGGLKHKAADVPVEVHEQLLADWSVMI